MRIESTFIVSSIEGVGISKDRKFHNQGTCAIICVYLMKLLVGMADIATM